MWWGAASPILNDTPVVYTTYNRTRIRNVPIYIYIYINTELLDGNQGHQEETHRPTHRFRRLFLDLLSMGWRGCASAVGAIKLPPSCSSPKINLCFNIQECSISDTIVYAVAYLNHILTAASQVIWEVNTKHICHWGTFMRWNIQFICIICQCIIYETMMHS